MPDSDTLGRFRHILIQNGLQEALFKQAIGLLPERRFILKKGTIVDSAIIEAPSSTKNRKRKRNPEAHFVKKNSSWHVGYKSYIGAEGECGLVHTVKGTPANIHAVTVMAELLTGEEETELKSRK